MAAATRQKNISLDKHLEEKSWQDAPPKKKETKKTKKHFHSMPSVRAASQQPPLSAQAAALSASTPWWLCLTGWA